jgi:hypothetical protein
MSIRETARLIGAVTILAIAAPIARAQNVTKTVATTAKVNSVSNFGSASTFTRLSLKDLSTQITYIYFITTVSTQSNAPYQIQARLASAYAYMPVQARLWDGTGTYVAITTTTSQIVAKGNPRTPQTDEVRFRVALPKGQTMSSLPAPTIVYTVAPQ